MASVRTESLRHNEYYHPAKATDLLDIDSFLKRTGLSDNPLAEALINFGTDKPHFVGVGPNSFSLFMDFQSSGGRKINASLRFLNFRSRGGGQIILRRCYTGDWPEEKYEIDWRAEEIAPKLKVDNISVSTTVKADIAEPQTRIENPLAISIIFPNKQYIVMNNGEIFHFRAD